MAIISSIELAAYLGIPDGDDALLAFAASAASEAVKTYCDRDFDTVAVLDADARVFYPTSSTVCPVDEFWELTALVVTSDDNDDGAYETTWTVATDFVLEPANGRTWPYTAIRAVGTKSFTVSASRPTVEVTAAWGWATVPAPVKSAALIKGARLFRRKDSPEGVLGGFQDFTAVRVSLREDPDVTMLLNPYRTQAAALPVA